METRTAPRPPAPPARQPGRIRRLVTRHPGRAALAAVVLAGLLVFGLYWFQPWKLFVDQSVNEAVPTAGSARVPEEPSPEAPGGTGGTSEPPGATTAPPAGPVVLSEGSFRSLEHGTTGTAQIIELPDGSRFVRFEDLRTSNGPDLIVILSDTPATEDSWGAYDDGSFVSLGRLKGNIGDQNYEIPSNVDLSAYESVVVWCRRFTVGFGAAPVDVPA